MLLNKTFLTYVVGSEEDCAEQVQILSAVGGNNDDDDIYSDEMIITTELSTHHQDLHDDMLNENSNY